MTLVSDLPSPPGVGGMVTDDVDDPAGRVEGLVDRLAGGGGGALQLLPCLAATAAGSAPADCLPLQISERFGGAQERRFMYVSILTVLFCFI